MISYLLGRKIIQMFGMMILGCLLVKTGIVKAEDSTAISKICLYLILPAALINAFQVGCDSLVRSKMVFVLIVTLLGHTILFAIGRLCKTFFHISNVEYASMVYPNGANLIIPVVASVLGDEWIVVTVVKSCCAGSQRL